MVISVAGGVSVGRGGLKLLSIPFVDVLGDPGP